ncbi:hypothetical protein SLA_0971 [Streptomyces laurentii]|uniref:Uncharacterized protein n=1 Tax=Streptomyces laurentii TaxID=39478 RepID=A0A169N5E2_STRLU|nr:hypothetical protein SLA_0971 [Streptomyces laurentii]
MSDQQYTGVNTGGGAAHTGSGDQHNHFTFHLPKDPGPEPFRPLAEDHLRWLEPRFVWPARMPDAITRLRARGTLLVDGAPGSGRNATARMLLHRLGGPRAPRQLLAEDDKARLDLQDDQVSEGDRLLLDLADADEQTWNKVHGKLPSLHHTVRLRGAHLVVVLPHGIRHPSNELEAHRFTVLRPDATTVLTRALRAEEDPVVQSPDELPADIREYVATGPPLRDVARLAGLIAESRRVKPRDGLKQWCADALTSLRELRAEVARRLITLEDGAQRALLLAVAMMHGRRTGAVHAVEDLLLYTLRHPADERPLLDWEDLSQRVKAIGASIRPDDTVVFDLPGYAAAVRTHFWTHRPGLWGHFRRWVDRAVCSEALDTQDRDALVAGYAEQALRTGQSQRLLDQARQWTEDGSPSLVQAAVQALGLGLSDPHAGREFRHQAYVWSTDAKIPTGLVRALVAVSADVIAVSHPDQALVRLHHLARQAGPGNREASERLLSLAFSDERLHLKLLSRLERDLDRHDWPADVRLFHSAAAPDRVTVFLGRPADRELLVSGWRALFTRGEPSQWLPQVHPWLAAAGPDRVHGGLLLDVLVDAATPSPAVLARLYQASRRYPCNAPLRRRIDAAQGIGPVTNPF